MHIPQDTQELLAGFVMGDLTPEEVAEINRILETQPELQAEIDRLQFTLSLLPLALPQTAPSSALKENILQSLAPIENKPIKSWRWLWGMGAVMAVLVTGWAFDTYHLRQKIAGLENQFASIAQNSPQNPPKNSQAQMFMLKSMDRNDNAWGVISLEPQRQMAVVQIRNLEPTPSNQTYRLWVVDMNGKMIDCGELRPDARGRVSKELPVSQPLVKGASITLEPMETSPQPKGKTVMESDV